MTQDQTQVAREVSWLKIHIVLAALLTITTAIIYLSSSTPQTSDWLFTAGRIYSLLLLLEVTGHLGKYNSLFQNGIERVLSWFDSSTDMEVTDG